MPQGASDHVGACICEPAGWPASSSPAQTGRTLLASAAPTPYRSLVELLYSEKRPGDLPARQAIVDLVAGLFDVFPSTAPYTPPLDAREWGTPMLVSASNSPALDAGPVLPMLAKATSARPSARTLVRTLMVGPPDEKEATTVDWIRQSRRPKVFKRWIEELVALLCDYFWCVLSLRRYVVAADVARRVFCHSGNGFVRMQTVNEHAMEAPTVPGGMSGGVEAVAMDYAVRQPTPCSRQAHTPLSRTVLTRSPRQCAAAQLHLDARHPTAARGALRLWHRKGPLGAQRGL
jgi:hypothetical protein